MHASYPTVAASIVALLLTYTASIIIYRVSFHPLSKYPGPFLAKITGWYDAYHSWKKDRHYDQYRCYLKYGPIFRYGPNYLVFNTEAVKTIYSGPKAHIRKAPNYRYLHEGGVASIATVIDKDVHARKRRVLSQAFSDAAMRSLEEYMLKNVELWCDLLHPSGDGWSEPRNMTLWANYLTFDVLGDLCFGRPFGLLTSSDHRYVPRLMLNTIHGWLTIGNSPLLPYWKTLSDRLGLDRIFGYTFYSDREAFKAFATDAVNARVAEYQKEGQGRKDFFYWLLNAKDNDGIGFQMTELWLESRTLITAGSDTSAITIAAAFYYLCRNPSVLARLQNELRSTFKSIDEVHSGPKMSSCVYLRAVIDETLRISPPVPSSSAREVEAGGIIIDEQYIPPGTVVGGSCYCLHHSPDYYPEPSSFKPERWLVSDVNSAEQVARARTAFFPFSLGSRGCVGKPVAYAEISIALGLALYKYDVRLQAGDKTGEGLNGEFATADVFVCERNGPIVQFKLAA